MRVPVGLKVLALGVLATAVAGCSQTAGHGVGPIALVDPNQAQPVVVGPPSVMTGALSGALTPLDQKAAREAEYRALEYGQTGVPITWKNGKDYGEVVPGANYRVNTYDCRDLVHTIHIGDKTQSARTTACRQPNGDWQPVT